MIKLTDELIIQVKRFKFKNEDFAVSLFLDLESDSVWKKSG